MSTAFVHRPPAALPAQGTDGSTAEFALRPPPTLPEPATGGGGRQALTVLPVLAGAGATALFVSGSGGTSLSYLASGMMALSMLGTAAAGVGRGAGERRRRVDRARRDYLRHLARARRDVQGLAGRQRAAALRRHPAPRDLWCAALAEPVPTDRDEPAVRVALGTQPLAVALAVPADDSSHGPAAEPDPVALAAVRRFVRVHAEVRDTPVTLALPEFGRLELRGPDEPARALTRALIAQAITFHGPDRLLVAVCAPRAAWPRWEWVSWAPHALSPAEGDAAGPARLIAEDLPTLERRLGDSVLGDRPAFGGATTTPAPHVLLVVDGGDHGTSRVGTSLIAGVTVLDLGRGPGRDPASGPGVGRLDLGAEVVLVRSDAGGREQRTVLGRPDSLGPVEAETLTRRLAARAAGTAKAAHDLGTSQVHDAGPGWRARAAHERLRVTVGVDPDGRPVELDLKESAQGGMGPHGLVIGATGSGKSEFLRTLVLGLAATHPPDELNLVLVDFKGGATFARLDALPHTCAVITNLADRLPLVDRMRDALAGELVRRQEVLRAAGDLGSLRDYEQARSQGAELAPLPSLLVVVDEFSELLSARPDFVDLFVMIGRLGRSLGVHLLLASQRLDEGRLRGLDTQLSYRVGLRTFSPAESRTVLGVPDAYELPSAPGHGYLRGAGDDLIRFRSGYVSGPAPTAARSSPAAVVPFRPDPVEPPAVTVPDEAPPTTLDVVVGRLAGCGTPARRIWLPPLDEPPTLDALLADGTTDEPLSVPIGVVDRPFEQRRDPFRVRLAVAHLVVVGRPHSGKSTTLRTLVGALALTHSVEQVQVYCLDLAGGGLAGLDGLPHVGAVATPADPELLRRTVAEVTALLARREESFAAQRLDSMAAYRRAVDRGEVAGDGYGDVVLVVDGWGTLRSDHESLELAVTRLAARGLGHGVHVVLSAQRWSEIRPAVRDLVAGRLELRLGDPAESELDRQRARVVPEDAPGRGLTADGLHLLTALPRVDGRPTSVDLAAGLAGLVAHVRQRQPGPGAPPVRLLPLDLPVRDLPAPPDGGARLPIGVDEDTLSPVCVDLDADPHLLVLGDRGTGKTNLLRVLAGSVGQHWSPDEARVITVDYRRGLAGAAGHQLAQVRSPATLPEAVDGIVAALRGRLAALHDAPDGDAAARWGGPRLIVLVDDYDLVAATGSPLAPLIEFLPQARDLGLHLVVARASGGAGQGVYEPVLRTLRDLGTPGLLLSGSRDEGAVVGAQRMEPLPTGRARLVRRTGEPLLVQTAHADPGGPVATHTARTTQTLRSTDTTRPRIVASSASMGE